MSICTRDEVIKFLDVEDADPENIINTVRDGVEAWVQTIYCRRNFESQAYSERYDTTSSNLKYYNYIGANTDSNGSYSNFGYGNTSYDGTGYILTLKQYPITAITRIAIGTKNAIEIKNTSVGTSATVSVSTTGLTLVKDGVSNTSVTFASNTTLNAVVTAVNALGNGWSASLSDSTLSTFLSTELIKRFGASAINSNTVYLQIPEEAESDFEVYDERGQIYFPGRRLSGRFQVVINYTAGYTSTTMPNDLKLGLKILMKFMYQRRNEETFGLESWRIGDLSNTLNSQTLPIEAKLIFDHYKRIKF